MRQKEFLLFVSLPLFMSLASCQDTLVDDKSLETNSLANTRAINEQELTDFYWSMGERISLKRSKEKSFVLFRSLDENSIKTIFSKARIRMDADKIKPFIYDGTDNTGNAAKSFINYQWAEVKAYYLSFNNIPEITYAAPYYIGPNGDEFPLTNLIYVHLKDNGDISLLESFSKDLNFGIIGKFNGIPNLYIASCTKDSKGNSLEVANILYETGLFDGVEPVFMSIKPSTINDPNYISQWNLKSSSQYGIDFDQATSIMPSSNNIVIAVVDNGPDRTHEDLLLDTYSWNAVTQTSPSVLYTNIEDEDTRHGTMVTGIISAKTNNNKGIAGIASTAGIKVMSFSVNYDNATLNAHLAAAIIKAVDQGASVINNSWGGGTSNQSINYAIDYAVKNGRNGKGCILTFASGNTNSSSIQYPANYSPETDVIAVGATMNNGYRFYFNTPMIYAGSNYGTGLDVVAPGVDVPTTNNGGYYTTFTGTSAATAHVSAIAALVLAKNPLLSYQEAAYVIESTTYKQLPGYSFTSNKIGGTWNNEVGYGLVNTYDAVNLANSIYNSSSSLTILGSNSLTANSSGYAGTTLTVSPSNSNYRYIWSIEFVGQCNRWYIWPSNNGYGNTADISIYLDPSDAGGYFIITCKAFNGTTYIGSASHFLSVSP